MEISDILNYNSASFDLDIALLLEAYATDPSDCFVFDSEKIRDQIRCVNFTPTSIILSFGNYEVGAYYCGTLMVKIPYIKMKEKGLLTDSFLQIIDM